MLIGEDRGHYLLILVITPEEITRNWKQWKKLNFRNTSCEKKFHIYKQPYIILFIT